MGEGERPWRNMLERWDEERIDMSESGVDIRQAQHCDYESICSLMNRELGYAQVTVESLAQRMRQMEWDGNYETYVALQNGRVVGFIGIVQQIAFEIERDYFRIIGLAVGQEHQRQGIGSALLAHVEAVGQERGIDHFVLSSGNTRTGAHALFEKMGYCNNSFSFSKGSK